MEETTKIFFFQVTLQKESWENGPRITYSRKDGAISETLELRA